MKPRYGLLSVMMLAAVGLGGTVMIAQEVAEAVENPFATYHLSGQERYNMDPYVANATLQLSQQRGTVEFIYRNPNLKPWSSAVVYERAIDPKVLEELRPGQSIRRQFAFEGERYENEVRGGGIVYIRKNNDGTFRISVQYDAEIVTKAEDDSVTVLARFNGSVSGTQDSD